MIVLKLAFTLSILYIYTHSYELNPEALPPLHLTSGQAHMARIGFGTAAIQGRTKELVCMALDHGFRLFDTAQAKEWYQEDALGKALDECWFSLGKPSTDIMVVTKIHPRSFEPKKLIQSIQDSRRNIYIKLDDNRALDVVLLHSPWCWDGHCTPEEQNHSWQDAWRTLESLKGPHIGGVHAIGVSNFDASQLKDLFDMTNKKVSVVQNWMDPFHQDREVRRMCDISGVIYMAYSTLGTQWEHKLGRNPVLSSPDLQSIAGKYSVSVVEVVLSWAIQEGVVVIPRASSLDHIQINANLIGDQTLHHGLPHTFLDDEDMKIIGLLDGTLGSLW